MITASIYMAICSVTVLTIFVSGPLDFSLLVYLAALAIAIVGVPHGGLDHWAGRRLLYPRFANRWWLMFFPAYLIIACGFALSWHLWPTFAVVLFFIASAWHFGREESKASQPVGSTKDATNLPQLPVAIVTVQPVWRAWFKLLGHLNAIAIGGLVIWIPALLRRDELFSLLSLIVPSNEADEVQRIVTTVGWLACLLIPWASAVIVLRLMKRFRDLNSWVPFATISIAVFSPILLSFTVYFCGLHSIQGLHRLRCQQRMSTAEFVRAVMPLSVMAIVGITMAGWIFHNAESMRAVEQLNSSTIYAAVQTLFIGLSAIAVPHLLLHELDDHLSSHQLEKSYLLSEEFAS